MVFSFTTAQSLTAVPVNAVETGGLSGPPVKPLTLATLKTLRGLLPSSVPIVGCGGISSGSDAVEYAEAGATLVQLYTSFAYDGVGAPRRVKDEVSTTLAGRKTTWDEIVKSSVEKLSLRPKKPVDLFKDAQEQLKAALDEAGKRISLGDELVLLKEKVVEAVPVLHSSTPSTPTVADGPAPPSAATHPEKTLQELIREAEAALGLSAPSS